MTPTTTRADDLLGGTHARACKVEYHGQIYSGICASATIGGKVTEVELSRLLRGEVGGCEMDVRYIEPDEILKVYEVGGGI